MSESPAESARVLIWDLPVRLFHGLLIASFAGAWLTADSERWRALHITLGLTLAGLVVFRVVWGVIGPKHARFRTFVRGPKEVRAYLRSMSRGRPEHHAGHNPLGGWAVLALLGGLALTAGTGYWMDGFAGPNGLEDLHEGLAGAVLAIVGVHVLGVLVSSLLHRENLIAAMVNGSKRAAPAQAIRGPQRAVAALLLAVVLGYWSVQWLETPVGQVTHAAGRTHGDTEEH